MTVPAPLVQALSDRYEIERELGSGGMGTVYLARDLRHDRKVALKVFRPEVGAAVGAERFLREIRLAASLAHPHILPLFDSGEAADYLYYVTPYIEGESLRERIRREGPLPIPDAVRIVAALADALSAAHARGIVHRDLKPGNVLLSGRHALMADFGVAKALDAASDEEEGEDLTAFGMTVGTPQYMAPEQAAGEEVDHRADLYALGILAYEMLTGRTPFQGTSSQAVLAAHLTQPPEPIASQREGIPSALADAVMRCLEKAPEDRWQEASELARALDAMTTSSGAVPVVERSWGVLGKGRRRLVAVAVVLLAWAGFTAHWVYASNQERLWVAERLSEVESLADDGSYAEALSLALEVERVAPDDPTLVRLWPQFSFTAPVRTDPSGARVYRRPTKSPEEAWEYLGETPLERVRFPGLILYELEGASGPVAREDEPVRFRFEREGYRDVELLQTAILGRGGIPPMDPVWLTPNDSLPEGMVRIPGFTDEAVTYGDYFMDRHEVTNREFQAFVDAGGYRGPQYWVEPIVQNGRELEFEEAMTLFTDQTGRTGPATWRLGSHPEDQGDYPVGGVSWYEAAAFARWAGKELPSTTHRRQAMRHLWQTNHLIVPGSNLQGDGPRPVGWDQSMSTLGLYDMLGNVREWCYNPVPDQGRATTGGAWTDARFHAGWIIPKDPLDRDATHGFRLVRTFDEDTLLARLQGPVESTEERDYRAETPASDVEFEIYRRLHEYDPASVNATVERADTFDLWVREEVSFDLPYGERGGAYLYLPKDGPRPLQAVIYWGGGGLLALNDIDQQPTRTFDFFMRDGRAVAQPIFKGTFHRDDSRMGTTAASLDPQSRAFRDISIQWMQELSRTIDYLETRSDIDDERLGYYGLSWGGGAGPRVLALERRIGAAVLDVGGLSTQTHFLPEIDPFNFVTRVETPVLMINGEHDVVYPYETSQRPMFELLGTDPEHKKHYVTPAAHIVPRDEVIRESLNWLDRYLGPVGER